MVLCISKLDKFECVNTITMLVVKLLASGHRMGSSFLETKRQQGLLGRFLLAVSIFFWFVFLR